MNQCPCTRCELIRLNLDQCKENGRLTGVMCRVKDLETENACLTKENAEIKLRLALLERASKELLELAANFQYAYKAKKHHKRKIQKEDADSGEHREPKKRDADLDLEQDTTVLKDDLAQDAHSARSASNAEGPGASGVPAVPGGHHSRTTLNASTS